MSAGMAHEMATWDAVETAARVRARDVSASEVLEAAIARAEEARPLGAVVTETFDRARASLGEHGGPFAGVPTFIKDLAHVEGVRMGWGSRGANGYVSKKSDPVVKHIEATGMVSLGKSATPELGMTATAEPLGQPPCRNPWDTTRSSGGSSGGAAALVAAGVVPMAHASDGGGSIRIPASACGLVGLKVSRHRMDMVGSWLLPVNVAVQGCVSRTVRDTAAFWDAIETESPPKRVRAIGRVSKRAMGSLTIGVFIDPPRGSEVAPDVRNAVGAAAKLCGSLGHAVEEIHCPFEPTVTVDFMRYWGFVTWAQKVGASILQHPGFDATKLDPYSQSLARYFTNEKREAARSIRRLQQLTKKNDEIMTRFDVLVCPTLTTAAPKLGHLGCEVPFDTVFDRLIEYAPYSAIQNCVGAPAITLPLGRSAEGLPIGVQFAAAPGRDRLLLELALALEEAQPWELAAPEDH